MEKNAVGFYLSNHPLDNYQNVLSEMKIYSLADCEQVKAGERLTLAGIVSGFQVRHSKKGNRFCIFRLEDQTCGVKCLGWSDAYGKFSHLIKDDEILVVEGRIESNEGQEVTMVMEDVKKISEAVMFKAKKLKISSDQGVVCEEYFEKIFSVLSKVRGRCEVYLNLTLDDKLSLDIHSMPLKIQGSEQIENELREFGCQIEWIL